MAKGKKTSGKEKGLYTDPATLIMELFRTLPDKRYSVKTSMRRAPDMRCTATG